MQSQKKWFNISISIVIFSFLLSWYRYMIASREKHSPIRKQRKKLSHLIHNCLQHENSSAKMLMGGNLTLLFPCNIVNNAKTFIILLSRTIAMTSTLVVLLVNLDGYQIVLNCLVFSSFLLFLFFFFRINRNSPRIWGI